MSALRQEAPEQEPIAWIERNMQCDDFDQDSIKFSAPYITANGWEWVPLYASPVDVEALIAERDRLLYEVDAIPAIKAERDALMQAAKLALDVLERASDAGYGIESDDAIEALKKAGVK